MVHILVCLLLDASVNFSRAPGVRGALDAGRRSRARRHPDLGKGRRRHRRMAGDGGLSAHKRQPGAGTSRRSTSCWRRAPCCTAQTKRHRSSVSFRWTWSPAFGRHRIPEICGSPGRIGRILSARRPISRAIDPATKDCNGCALVRLPCYYIVIFYLCANTQFTKRAHASVIRRLPAFNVLQPPP